MRLTYLPGGQGQGGIVTDTGTQEDLGYLVLESRLMGLEWHTSLVWVCSKGAGEP